MSIPENFPVSFCGGCVVDKRARCTYIHALIVRVGQSHESRQSHSIPIYSLILSSNLLFCLLFFLFSFTVSCRIVFAKPEDLETWPKHLSFCFLTRVRSSSCSPMADWIFLRTPSFLTWSLYEISNSLQ